MRLATTVNIALQGLQTIDGVATAVGDRVLVKDQVTASENGIYTASDGQWYRAADARSARTIQKGTTAFVQDGASNGEITFRFNTMDPVIGTDAIDITGDGDALLRADLLDEDDMASDSDSKVPTQQSVKTYVDGKVSPRYTTEFGFVDDGITNNDAAWNLAVASLTQGQILVTVKQHATHNYKFFAVGDFTALAIDATSGPTFTGDFVYNYGTTNIKAGNLKLLNTGATSWKRGFDIVPKPDNRRPKETFLHAQNFDPAAVVPIDLSNASLERIAWPAGDTWAVGPAGAMQTAAQASFDLGTIATAFWYGAFVPAKSGGEYKACWHGNGTTRGIMVRTEAGYRIAYGTTLAEAVTYTTRTYGVGSSSASLPSVMNNDNQDGYRLPNATLGVRIISPTKFCFTLNGIDITTQQTTASPIVDVGMVVFQNPGETGSVVTDNWVRVDNGPAPVPNGQRILIFGDSITDGVNPGWPEWLAWFLQGSCGLQVDYVNNIAVAGQTAEQQDTIMAGMSLSGYTLAIGMVGTNNIQGQTASFPTVMQSIINRLANAFIPLVVAVPPMFYNRADAVRNGAVGQNSVNGGFGSYYRNVIMKTIADKAAQGYLVGMVEAAQAMTPALAYHLAWNATGMMQTGAVFDNIHPDMQNRIAFAFALARKAMALLAPPYDKSLPFTAIPASWYRNSWQALTTPVFWLDATGRKHLDGIINTAAGPTADGTQVLQLPKYMWPQRAQWQPVITQKANVQSWLDVTTAGVATAYGVDATNKFIRLGDVNWD
ncbi:hypothetical protein O7A70_24405 [Mesorhizobium sp. Cs1299R1N1]|uniref:SGNH/GDSL hydrolase family protein n=1 Tax=Mesorhizobium sp. Cs1299R1N1 TaxID=3015172 RepID=UPI00301C1252